MRRPLREPLKRCLLAAILVGLVTAWTATVAADAAVIPGTPGGAFPVRMGGPFRLIDHNGVERTERDFGGRHLLVLFAYTNCEAMCSPNLHLMASALERLGALAQRLQPLMITVDPGNDKPAVMRAKLAEIHPDLLGLTGTPEALEQVYRDFHFQPREVAVGQNGATIFTHSSYFYLLGPDGEFLTLIPPILDAGRVAATVATYL